MFWRKSCKAVMQTGSTVHVLEYVHPLNLHIVLVANTGYTVSSLVCPIKILVYGFLYTLSFTNKMLFSCTYPLHIYFLSL